MLRCYAPLSHVLTIDATDVLAALPLVVTLDTALLID